MTHVSEAAYSLEDLQDPQLVAGIGEGARILVKTQDGTELVLMTKADLEGLEETLAILSDADAVKALDRSLAEAARGDVVPLEEVSPPRPSPA